jgi:hypothetical protein
MNFKSIALFLVGGSSRPQTATTSKSSLNYSDKGPFYNVTVSRSYKDGETWKSSDSFGRDDLLVLAQLLGSAYTFILQKQAEN